MNLAKSITTILLLGCLLPSAHSMCHSVDLRGPVLGESRLQKPLSWCFAYAAGDMLSVALGRRISAFDLALLYYKEQIERDHKIGPRQMTDWKAGRISPLLEQAAIEGVCVDSAFSASSRENTANLAKLDDLITSLHGRADSARRMSIANALERNPSFQKLFPSMKRNELTRSLLSSSYSQYPLIDVSENVCRGNRISISGLKLEKKIAQGRNEALDFIDTQLAKGRAVAIGYNSVALKDLTNTKGVDHLSTIIGSRPRGNSCEYLLRNPWGSFDASRFHPELIKKRDGDYVWLSAEFVKSLAVQLYAIGKDQ